MKNEKIVKNHCHINIFFVILQSVVEMPPDAFPVLTCG